MKLDARALAFASALLMALLYSLCVLVVVLAPEAYITSVRALFHIAVSGPATITWGDFAAGLVAWPLGAWAGAFVLAGVYNRLARKTVE